MSARIGFSTIISDDFEQLFDMYRATFEMDEVVELRNERFRALDGGGCRLSFTPATTYASLGIEEWSSPTGASQYLTFEVDSDDEVETRAERAVELGSTLVRPPFETHYASWQAVLADPAGNVFRINHFR